MRDRAVVTLSSFVGYLAYLGATLDDVATLHLLLDAFQTRFRQWRGAVAVQASAGGAGPDGEAHVVGAPAVGDPGPVPRPWARAVAAKASIWALLPAGCRGGVLNSPNALASRLLLDGLAPVCTGLAKKEVRPLCMVQRGVGVG
jgi:hypothetical protein